MKVFIMRNIDGRNTAMVAAPSQVEAAKKLHTTPYMMRQMGWSLAAGEDAAVALAKPGIVLYRPIDGGDYPWSEFRYERDYTGVRTYRLTNFTQI